MDDRPRTETLPSGEPLPTVRLFAPGTEIGRRYEIRRVLGSGGSAVVYAAWDRELKREIALKVLRHARLTEQAMLRRFRREVAVARGAGSPRLVKVYDIGTSAEAVFLTMELIHGELGVGMLTSAARRRPTRLPARSSTTRRNRCWGATSMAAAISTAAAS